MKTRAQRRHEKGGTQSNPVTLGDSDNEDCVESMPRAQRSPDMEEIATYPESGSNCVVLTRGDMKRLAPGVYLNDNLVDFYCQYLWHHSSQKDRFHLFSSFFYKRLIQDTVANYKTVEKWTKRVDIFEKDFLVLPINYDSHWSLIIVCFPRFALPERYRLEHERKRDEKSTVDMTGGEISSSSSSPPSSSPTSSSSSSSSNGNTNSESDGRPCILHLDSFGGHHNRKHIAEIIRGFLTHEWNKRNSKDGFRMTFNMRNLPGLPVKVAQQMNFCDCGVYLLEFMRRFLQIPFTDPQIAADAMQFGSAIVEKLRIEIYDSICQISRKTDHPPYPTKAEQKFLDEAEYGGDVDPVIFQQMVSSSPTTGNGAPAGSVSSRTRSRHAAAATSSSMSDLAQDIVRRSAAAMSSLFNGGGSRRAPVVAGASSSSSSSTHSRSSSHKSPCNKVVPPGLAKVTSAGKANGGGNGSGALDMLQSPIASDAMFGGSLTPLLETEARRRRQRLLAAANSANSPSVEEISSSSSSHSSSPRKRSRQDIAGDSRNAQDGESSKRRKALPPLPKPKPRSNIVTMTMFSSAIPPQRRLPPPAAAAAAASSRKKRRQSSSPSRSRSRSVVSIDDDAAANGDGDRHDKKKRRDEKRRKKRSKRQKAGAEQRSPKKDYVAKEVLDAVIPTSVASPTAKAQQLLYHVRWERPPENASGVPTAASNNGEAAANAMVPCGMKSWLTYGQLQKTALCDKVGAFLSRERWTCPRCNRKPRHTERACVLCKIPRVLPATFGEDDEDDSEDEKAAASRGAEGGRKLAANANANTDGEKAARGVDSSRAKTGDTESGHVKDSRKKRKVVIEVDGSGEGSDESEASLRSSPKRRKTTGESKRANSGRESAASSSQSSRSKSSAFRSVSTANAASKLARYEKEVQLKSLSSEERERLKTLPPEDKEEHLSKTPNVAPRQSLNARKRERLQSLVNYGSESESPTESVSDSSGGGHADEVGAVDLETSDANSDAESDREVGGGSAGAEASKSLYDSDSSDGVINEKSDSQSSKSVEQSKAAPKISLSLSTPRASSSSASKRSDDTLMPAPLSSPPPVVSLPPLRAPSSSAAVVDLDSPPSRLNGGGGKESEGDVTFIQSVSSSSSSGSSSAPVASSKEPEDADSDADTSTRDSSSARRNCDRSVSPAAPRKSPRRRLCDRRSVSPSRNLDSDEEVTSPNSKKTAKRSRVQISLADSPVRSLKKNSTRLRRRKQQAALADSDGSDNDGEDLSLKQKSSSPSASNSKKCPQRKRVKQTRTEVVDLNDTSDADASASSPEGAGGSRRRKAPVVAPNALARIESLLRGGSGGGSGGVHTRTRAKKGGGRDKAHAISID